MGDGKVERARDIANREGGERERERGREKKERRDGAEVERARESEKERQASKDGGRAHTNGGFTCCMVVSCERRQRARRPRGDRGPRQITSAPVTTHASTITHTRTQQHAHTKHNYTHTHTHTHTLTHTHTYTYTYTYTHTHKVSALCQDDWFILPTNEQVGRPLAHAFRGRVPRLSLCERARLLKLVSFARYYPLLIKGKAYSELRIRRVMELTHKRRSLTSVSSTPALVILTVAAVLPPDEPTASIFCTTSIPSSTSPNTTCLPSRKGVGTVQMKNWSQMAATLERQRTRARSEAMPCWKGVRKACEHQRQRNHSQYRARQERE